MELERKINILVELGQIFNQLSDNKMFGDDSHNLNTEDQNRYQKINLSQKQNSWFTKGSIQNVFQAWASSLAYDKVEKWLSNYSFNNNNEGKLGLILAGNIPLVGLHDILSGLICDYQLLVKPSSKDTALIELIISELLEIAPEWSNKLSLVDKLNDVDVFIATGSNNSARYFDYYFRDTPKLIRKNRTSVAVIDNKTTDADLKALGEDIFAHFGLGCRNVTKLYFPKDFDKDRFFSAIFNFQDIINHNKYANNYDYNKAVYLMNKIELVENGFLLLKEDDQLHSPVGVIFYQFYDDLNKLSSTLKEKQDSIQAVVSNAALEGAVPFGYAQKPELWNYADGVDTIEFLLKSKE